MTKRIKELAKAHLVREEYTEFGWQECHQYSFDEDDLTEFAKLVAEKERDACAKVCEQHGFDHYCGNVTDKIAKTIRARGQANG